MTKICYTALIGPYENLKDPAVISEGWKYLAYTDQPLTSDVWEIIPVIPGGDRMTARALKIQPPFQYDQCFWVDASFRIEVDLNDWWARYFRAPFTTQKHPLRTDWLEEVHSCMDSNRCRHDILEAQRIEYTRRGLKRYNGIIQSGIIMRSPGCEELCKAWWLELSQWSTRDQLAFAAICSNFEYHVYEWDYRREKDFIYYKHYHLR